MTPPSGTYTNTMNISGSFTLANPLSVNLPASTDITALVQSFSFSDGRDSFNESNSDFSFRVGTDALGNISSWLIIADGNLGTIGTATTLIHFRTSSLSSIPDIGFIDVCDPLTNGVCFIAGEDDKSLRGISAQRGGFQ